MDVMNDQLVEWMRARGVRAWRRGDTYVELVWPAPGAAQAQDDGPAMPPAQAFADVDGAGVCSCGHSWLEHTDQGCLAGCSHEVCVSASTVDGGP